MPEGLLSLTGSTDAEKCHGKGCGHEQQGRLVSDEDGSQGSFMHAGDVVEWMSARGRLLHAGVVRVNAMSMAHRRTAAGKAERGLRASATGWRSGWRPRMRLW